METKVNQDTIKRAERQIQISENKAMATQVILKKKLEELFQQSHELQVESSHLKNKKKSLNSKLTEENQALKAKLIELRGEIINKLVQVTNVEGDTSERKRTAASVKTELFLDSHQKNMLEVKVCSLQEQLAKQLIEPSSQQIREEVESLKSKLKRLEEDCYYRKEELEREGKRREMFEKEYSIIKNSLKDAQKKNATLDILLATLQAEYDSSRTSLTQISRNVEKKLQLATEDLEKSQQLVTECQDMITTMKHVLDTTTDNLQVERQASKELQNTIQVVDEKLKESDSKQRRLEDELDKIKLAALESEQSMDAANNVTSTHKLMLEESKSNLVAAHAEIKKLSKTNKVATAENMDFKKMIDMQLVEKDSALQKKEGHIISLENEIELNCTELKTKARKINEIQKEINERADEMKPIKFEMDNIKCSISCLQEKNGTLKMELASTQEELLSTKDINESVMHKLDLLTKTYEDEHAHDQKSINQLKDEISQTKTCLAVLIGQHTSLESDNKKNCYLLEAANNELEELRKKSSILQENLKSSTATTECLEKKLKNQLDDLMGDHNHKTSELKHANNRLSMMQDHLDGVEQEIVTYKVDLHKKMDDDERKDQKLKYLILEIQQVKGERSLEKDRADAMYAEKVSLRRNTEDLTKKLNTMQQEMNEIQKVSEDAHENYDATFSSLKSKHQEELHALTAEHDTLMNEITQLKENLFIMDRDFNINKEELDVATDKLSRAEMTCTQQKAALCSKASLYDLLKSQPRQLESETAEARVEIAALKNKIFSQTYANNKLKNEVNELKKECTSLNEKQKETASLSLNRILKDSQEKSIALHVKIQETSAKLDEMNASFMESQQDLARVQLENNTLKHSLAEEINKRTTLKLELCEQTKNVKLLEQHVDHYQLTKDLESNTKIVLKQSISDERLKRQKFELFIVEQEGNYAITTRELSHCKKHLMAEQAKNEQLNMEIGDSLQTKKQHDALKKLQENACLEMEKQMESLRQKSHEDTKSLKGKIKTVRTKLQDGMDQLEEKCSQVQALETNARKFAGVMKELGYKLSKAEHKLLDKRKECDGHKEKQKEFEIQVTDLQADIRRLEKAQTQIEEFRKKSDSKSKSEIKRVLSEVTEYMEQQFFSQRCLEKLRRENEMIAMKEKEKVISRLNGELKLTKQGIKQDKMHLKELKLESAHLKNQQIERERSRHRLEAQLDQVNKTLKRYMPSSSFKSCTRSGGPIHTSPPSLSRTCCCNEIG